MSRLLTKAQVEQGEGEQVLATLADRFRAVVTAPDFPCTFTWLPFSTGELAFATVDLESENYEDEVVGLLEDLARRTQQQPDLIAVIFVVDPTGRLTSLEEDFAEVRKLVQAVVRRDPAAHVDSSRSDWSLTVAGVPLFVNASSPHHVSRHSRNVGPALTLICQTIASFLEKGRSNPPVLAHIRSRLAQYDGAPAHPALGVIGHPGNREAWQIFLGDGVEPYDPTVIDD